MSYLFVALILLTGYYVFVVMILFIGTLKLKRGTSFATPESRNLPFVSVIVAARNEEMFIGECIRSLLDQDYPKDKYEITIVNDRSTDRTGQIVKEFQKISSSNEVKDLHPNIVCVDVTVDPVEMAGKQNALDVGLKNSKGSIILTTDADCVTKPSWIRTMVSYFDEKTGMVIGFPVTYEKKSKPVSFFTKMQSLDLVHLLNCAVGIIGWKKPISAIGNNMAYRPEIIDEIGGFRALGFSLSDDAALIRTVGQKTDWQIHAAPNSDAVVITKPAKNFRQFYRQRRRWMVSGHIDSPKWGIVSLQFILLFYLLLIGLIPVAIFLNSTALLLGVAISFLIKVLVDLIPAYDIFRRLNRLNLLKLFIPYEIFQILYGVLIWFGSMLYKRVIWKDQSY